MSLGEQPLAQESKPNPAKKNNVLMMFFLHT